MSIVNKLQDLTGNKDFLLGIGIFILGTLLSKYVWKQQLVFSLIVGFIVAGIAIMVLSDINQRKIAKQSQLEVEEILLEKKRKQAEQEAKEAKCVSCNKPLDPNAENCTHCGYKVHKYSVDP